MGRKTRAHFFCLRCRSLHFSPPGVSQGGRFKCIIAWKERKAVVLKGWNVRDAGSTFLSSPGVRSGHWRSQKWFPRNWRMYSVFQICMECCTRLKVWKPGQECGYGILVVPGTKFRHKLGLKEGGCSEKGYCWRGCGYIKGRMARFLVHPLIHHFIALQ